MRKIYQETKAGVSDNEIRPDTPRVRVTAYFDDEIRAGAIRTDRLKFRDDDEYDAFWWMIEPDSGVTEASIIRQAIKKIDSAASLLALQSLPSLPSVTGPDVRD